MARRENEPFLNYLTVFKSRLGLANIVLDVTTFGHQPERALKRRVRQVLDRRIDLALADPGNTETFQYLLDKKIVSSNFRTSGRYRNVALAQADDGSWRAEARYEGTLTRFPVYQTDIWLAHSEIPSTIGVPTPDNLDEVIEFAFQLQLLDSTKNAWTSSGHLVNGLRSLTRARLPDSENPFLLGVEAIALLRCLLEKDGLFLLELARFLNGYERVRRDDVATALPTIAEAAVDMADRLTWDPRAVSAGRKLVAKWAETDSEGKSSAPGVLEHRSSPRLEWLTDLGYLSKEGLAKNGFEYRVTHRLAPFVDALDEAVSGGGDWAFNVALSAWHTNDRWQTLRDSVSIADDSRAIRTAYEALRRPIGPAPLRDVAFVTGLLMPIEHATNVTERIIEVTKETPGASLSGGRLTRAPENIYMTDEALRALETA